MMLMEVRCSRALALALGAVEPRDVEQVKKLKAQAYLLMRDMETSCPLFWLRVHDAVSTIR